MSNLIRKSTFSLPLRRGITVTATHQESLASASEFVLKKSNSGTESSDLIRDSKSTKTTIKDLRSELDVQYTPLYASNSAGVKTEVSISSIQARDGQNVRSWIVNENYNKLWALLAQITERKDAAVLTKVLVKEEITILLRKLCIDQLRSVRIDSRSVDAHNSLTNKKHKLRYTQVCQMMSSVSKVPGYELSSLDTDLILNLLIKNQDFNKASVWFKAFEESINGQVRNDNAPNFQSFTPSLTFQNIKLKVLGETSPLRWKFPRNHYIKKEAHDMKLATTEPWDNILHGLPRSQYVFNRETHIELISGLSKHGNLQQVKDYIHQVWGISANGSAPQYIIGKSSLIYPNYQLIERLITIFAYHDKLNEALSYLTSFDRYYELDMSRRPIVWGTLIDRLLNSGADREDIAQSLVNIWKLMKHKEVRFTTGLFKKRLFALKGTEHAMELIEDIPVLFEKFQRQTLPLEVKKLEKLIYKYLTSAVEILYKHDLESDKSVASILNTYSINNKQLISLKKEAEVIKTKAVVVRKRFEQLQEQYDQEDEEDALW